MAIGNRTATTANSGAAAATTVTLNLPTGTSSGDLLIATISVNGGTGITITAPSGFTLFNRANNTTVLGQGIYYRVCDGTETSTYQWTVTSCFVAGVLGCYTGVDNTAPFAGTTTLGKTSASTSATFSATTPLAETVYAVLCTTSRNTTAGQTLSAASSGWTVDGDTHTTATTFIQAAHQDQHTTFGEPLAAFTPGSATISTSSTDIDTAICLRPTVSQTGLNTVFASANSQKANSGTVSVTNVQTHYSGLETLYAFVIDDGNGGGGSPGSNSVTGGGLTWTLRYHYYVVTLVQGNFQVYTAVPNTTLSASTITYTNANSTGADASMLIVSFLNADQTTWVGSNSGGAEFNPGAATKTIATTVNNSWVWGLYYDTGGNTSATIGSNQTKVFDFADTNDAGRQTFSKQNAVTSSSGTNVTMNYTAPTGHATSISAVEILAAPAAATGSPSLMLTGMGM